MVGIRDKLSGKSNTDTSNTEETSNPENRMSSSVPKTESLIIDDAVPPNVNVAGPTTIEYDLEGKPRPEILSTKKTYGMGEPSVGSVGQSSSNLSSPIRSTSNAQTDLSTRNYDNKDLGTTGGQDFSTGGFDTGHHTATDTTRVTQPSHKHDATTTIDKAKEMLDPNSRQYNTNTTDYGNQSKFATTQPGYSPGTEQSGHLTSTATQPSQTTYPAGNIETSNKTTPTTTAPTTGHRRHSSSSSKKSNTEDESIINKIKTKLHIGSSHKETTPSKYEFHPKASHTSYTKNNPDSNKYNRNLGVQSDASAVGAAAAYNKQEASR